MEHHKPIVSFHFASDPACCTTNHTTEHVQPYTSIDLASLTNLSPPPPRIYRACRAFPHSPPHAYTPHDLSLSIATSTSDGATLRGARTRSAPWLRPGPASRTGSNTSAEHRTNAPFIPDSGFAPSCQLVICQAILMPDILNAPIITEALPAKHRLYTSSTPH